MEQILPQIKLHKSFARDLLSDLQIFERVSDGAVPPVSAAQMHSAQTLHLLQLAFYESAATATYQEARWKF